MIVHRSVQVPAMLHAFAYYFFAITEVLYLFCDKWLDGIQNESGVFYSKEHNIVFCLHGEANQEEKGYVMRQK